jgi:plasmid maintenance system antidote protein VapI
MTNSNTAVDDSIGHERQGKHRSLKAKVKSSRSSKQSLKKTQGTASSKRKDELKDLVKMICKAHSKNSSDLPVGKLMNPDQPLNKFRGGRQNQSRDTKIIITSRNSTTGTGKTTLAVWLALNWDQYGFTADKATLNPSEYIDKYLETRPGEVLIMDEAEQLDARRSMSNKNLEFADRWQQLRYRQVDSILTLPTASALDKRLEELADIWINVTGRGYAQVHRTTVNDRTKKINQIPLQTLTWPDISDHEVKKALDRKKEKKNEAQNQLEKSEAASLDPEKVKQNTRNELIKSVYNDTELTQKELANAAGIDQSRVSQILKE